MNSLNYESWGRYPKSKAYDVIPLFWRNEIPELKKFSKKILPYGFGKSYGDSCLNDDGILLDTKGLNKLISFDKESGILRCEAGVSLSSVLDFIVPQGWFPCVTPGTKHISIAGAVANDIHGKNHHKNGTFGCHVTKFELIRSDGKYICSEIENPELFKATIGGMGLTGLITWVEFKTQPCYNAFFYVENIKYNHIEEFYELNEESDKHFDYTVAWVDTTATGTNLGEVFI
jgi:FAD/FMN-containing dehydrogenase